MKTQTRAAGTWPEASGTILPLTPAGTRSTAAERNALKSTPTWLMGVFASILIVGSPVTRAATTLTVGNTPGYPGATALVPVYLAQGSNVVVSQFDVLFSTSKVSTAGAPLAPRIAGQRVKSKEVAPGLQRVLAYSVNPAPNRFTNATRSIALLPFTLGLGQYGNSGPLAPTNALLIGRDGLQLPTASPDSGFIFAQPVFIQPDGAASFFLPSQPGTNYTIQASSDLVQWQNLSIKKATSDFIESSDPKAKLLDHRYYRLKATP